MRAWRAAGAIVATIAFIGTAAPSSVASLSSGDPFVDPAAGARPGAVSRHDPNHLTAEQVRERERLTERALAEKALAGQPRTTATVTIPVIVHVIAKDDTRVGGNIPDEMVAAQIEVLNQAYGATT